MGKLTLCQKIQIATKQYMLVLCYFLGSVYLEGVGGQCDLTLSSMCQGPWSIYIGGKLSGLITVNYSTVLKEQQSNQTTVSFGSVECLLKGSYCVITTPHIGTGQGNHMWLYSKQQSIISKYSAVIDLHSNRRIIYHVYHLFSFCCNTSK